MTTKPRWLHTVTDFEIDLIEQGSMVHLTFRTDDEADHSFVLDKALLARLADECARLRAS